MVQETGAVLELGKWGGREFGAENSKVKDLKR